jgi:hypothetical protein
LLLAAQRAAMARLALAVSLEATVRLRLVAQLKAMAQLPMAVSQTGPWPWEAQAEARMPGEPVGQAASWAPLMLPALGVLSLLGPSISLPRPPS